MRSKFKNSNNGITLIALVITIIVLLILAGVAIATLTGENGILTRAQDAKNKTEQSQKDEENILNSYEDKINEYTGIDWDTILANAEKHPDQVTSTAIGVGTDGKPVNMDLWEYTLLDNDTFALNDKEVIENVETIKNPGYKFGNNGENVIDGEIIGTIPQYISTDDGTTYKPVTDLTCTFSENSYLVHAPYIPSTVTNMLNTFIRCNNLTTIENLPDNLQNLGGAFKETALTSIPYLPDTITNLSQTFYNCNKLIYLPNIPKNLINMQQAFEGCSLLKNIDIEIPESVTNMMQAFSRCELLSGRAIIKANINGNWIDDRHYDYQACFTDTAISNENASLTLICTENIYNLFYDDTRPNKIKAVVASYNAKIQLNKI